MILKEIQHNITNCFNQGVHPDTVILNKTIEREMYLDGSFPKNQNNEDTIEIDNILYMLIITDNPNINIRVLGNKNITQ